MIINNLRQELKDYQINDPGLVNELNILFPELKDISMGKIEKYITPDSVKTEWLILYNVDKKSKRVDKAKMKNWLKERLKVQSIALVQNMDND
ncbi:hypothetical protein D9M70_596260 [compost metagenome]